MPVTFSSDLTNMVPKIFLYKAKHADNCHNTKKNNHEYKLEKVIVS